MEEEALIHLCCCYINTNYLSVEDVVSILGYEYGEMTEAFGCEFDKIWEEFEKVMTPVREARFEEMEKRDCDDWDLEWFWKVLARNLERLMYKIDKGN